MRISTLIAALALFPTLALAQTQSDAAWTHYGKDAGGSRFSAATQINRDNVTQLKVAWTFHTGALPHDPDLDKKAAFETTPILVDGKLFFTTPYDHVFAINAQTGEKIWEFDPQLELPYGASEVTSRGVSAWRDSKAKPGQPCALRIFFGTLDARLIALDGATGKPCSDFGDNGEVALTDGVKLRDPGDYQVTSAPAIAGDVVITGSSIGDNRAVTLERGIVRAYDVRTGKLRWSWDPIPWALKTTPRTGAGNAWSTISVDAERNLVFIPTGSASPDYYGGIRKGDNKWANSVVALKASTGEFVWGFQVVHHDIWDYDVASQPTLFTWKNNTPAIAISTKMGRVFVLNRLNGTPLIPVEEKPVPKSDIPGEESWPTQPSSISVVPETLSVDDAWAPTPELEQWCAEKIKAARTGAIFIPPSLQGTLVYPSNVGGVNWGSTAYDPANHLLIMNTNRLPVFVRMIPRDEWDAARKGASDLDRLHGEFARQTGAPFAIFRTPLLSTTGLPCNAPPWGTVAAVDLFSGKKVWDVPLGTYIPGQKTGTINLGGPMATAGGLVFSAAGMDHKIHAFDSNTGAELWSFELPAGGQATPMTYTLNGKQYLVIAAGGHGKLGTKQGDSLLAFTLP
ncbi:MAG TPA: pyrroloquinoline quinone-dependent dehydrogenase [Candidatus Acidoferrum sp.]|nr:pyrroloquinoline quinone-dependent dehydrogenase [Candidatus Acidoferrum sp.]